MTAIANTPFTAAQFNTHVRDNLNETAPAKATTPGRIFVVDGVNSIAERAVGSQTNNSIETTTSTSYTDLATPGPSVTATTGTRALVFINSRMSVNAAGGQAFAAIDVSGATTLGGNDANATRHESSAADDIERQSSTTLLTVNPGSNTFKMVYRVTGNTGTFADRHIVVIPL